MTVAVRLVVIRLGSKVALLGALVIVALWIAAALAWTHREQERLDDVPPAESATVRSLVSAALLGELGRGGPTGVDLAVLGARAGAPADPAAAALPLRDRVRNRLALLGLDASWLRERDGTLTWVESGTPAGGVDVRRSDPRSGPCAIDLLDGTRRLALCHEVAFGEGAPMEEPRPWVAGGATLVPAPAATGSWAVIWIHDPTTPLAASPTWPRLVVSSELLGARPDGSVAVRRSLVLGAPTRLESARLPGLPLLLVTAVADARPLDWLGLLRGEAGPVTAAWQRWLKLSGTVVAGGLIFFLLLGMGLNSAFAPVLDAAQRLAQGEAGVLVKVDRSDEIGALGQVVNDLGASLRATALTLERTARVAAWRDVARSVAHEIKNPLLPIRGTVENLLRWRAEEPERFERLFEPRMHTIIEEVDQLSRLAASFSELARMPLPVPERCDILRIVREVATLHASATGGVGVDDRLGDVEGSVLCDPAQLRRVVTNVVKNALEAQEGRGVIRLLAGRDESWLWFAVEDDGPGADQATLERLFTPYFTTKKDAGGTGLGLFTSQRIVMEHGARIAAEAAGGGGLRVTVALPIGGPAAA